LGFRRPPSILKDIAYFQRDAKRITPHYNPFLLVFARRSLHCLHMRIILLLVLTGGAGWGGEAVGVWKLSPGRSTFAADRQPRSLTLRIERHSGGEVFTVERTEQDGRSTTDSTVLFLDGAPRDYQDSDCRGTQSSHRLDSRTVEVLRTCENGAWMRVIRRVNTDTELVLEISGRRSDGRQVQMRLVLEKQ
jgi:hypothetical protein